MREFHKLIFEYIEEVLYLFSFIIFNIAMFKVGLIIGLVTLSIMLFIIASFITFIKSKGGEK